MPISRQGCIGKGREALKRKGEGPVIRFKACPRCRGDVEFLHDPYGDYLHCIQCGWM